jgi:hypothetical protein
MSQVHCPAGHLALVGKKRLLKSEKYPGLSIYFCPECKKKHVERGRWWYECGPGHEDQMLAEAVDIASQELKLRDFLDADADSPWFDRTEVY